MKRNAVALLRACGLFAAARVVQARRVVVLTYHGILSGDDDRYDFLNHNFISEAMFDRQLRFLKGRYRPITLRRLIDCYERGVAPPARSVAITFDDGFANNYSVAFPLLARHQFPFTVFLTTGLLGLPDAQLWTERVKRAIFLYPAPRVEFELLGHPHRLDLSSEARRMTAAKRVLQLLKQQPLPERNRGLAIVEDACGRPPIEARERERYAFLDWSTVREMAAAGVEFGSHTVHHPILSTLDEPTLRTELQASRQRIIAELGGGGDLFAYPNGSWADFGAREKQVLASLGYRAAFSLNGRLNGSGDDLFEIDRINVGRHLDLPTFEAAITGVLGAVRHLRQRLSAGSASAVPEGAGA